MKENNLVDTHKIKCRQIFQDTYVIIIVFSKEKLMCCKQKYRPSMEKGTISLRFSVTADYRTVYMYGR